MRTRAAICPRSLAEISRLDLSPRCACSAAIILGLISTPISAGSVTSAGKEEETPAPIPSAPVRQTYIMSHIIAYVSARPIPSASASVHRLDCVYIGEGRPVHY